MRSESKCILEPKTAIAEENGVKYSKFTPTSLDTINTTDKHREDAYTRDIARKFLNCNAQIAHEGTETKRRKRRITTLYPNSWLRKSPREAPT
jgi:hypothetical protein